MTSFTQTQRISLLLLLLTSLLLSLMYIPIYCIRSNDGQVFEYVGRAILKGKVPYKDVFDHKPPLIFFWNAAGLLMGDWGMWILDNMLVLFTTTFFFKRCCQYKLALPWVLPLLFNLMIRCFLANRDMGATREYSSICILLFFCVFIGNARHRYWTMGLLTGLIFFMQQEQVTPVLPFLLIALFAKNVIWQERFKFAGGFLLVLLPLLVYFAVNNALSYWWKDAFLFNMTTYTEERKTLMDHFRTIKRILDMNNYEVPVMISLALGITALFTRHVRKKLLVAALAAFLLSFIAEMMGGRPDGKGNDFAFEGYVLALTATIPILLFIVFAFTEEPMFFDTRARWMYACLLCAGLTYTSLQHATHMKRWDFNDDGPEFTWLQQQHLKDYELFVFFNGDQIFLYNELNMLAPTSWIYHHFYMWYAGWDTDQQMLKGIGDGLLRHRTRYVIYDPQRAEMFYDEANRQWWTTFLHEHYQQLDLTFKGRKRIWQLK